MSGLGNRGKSEMLAVNSCQALATVARVMCWPTTFYINLLHFSLREGERGEGGQNFFFVKCVLRLIAESDVYVYL